MYDQGEVVDMSGLKSAVEMLLSFRPYVDFSLYTEDFETPFLAESRIFYEQEAAQFMKNHSVSDFLKQVRKKFIKNALFPSSILCSAAC